jgi:hypothetical protein
MRSDQVGWGVRPAPMSKNNTGRESLCVSYLTQRGLASGLSRRLPVRPVPRLGKVRNPASIAVQRERSEIWNWRASGSVRRP